MTSKTDIEYRRLWVSRYMTRGYTAREIQRLMSARKDTINPDTGKPYSIGTIQGDIEHNRSAWRDEVKGNVEVAAGQLLAEIREVRRVAWSETGPDGKNKPDLDTVLKGLKQERDLLGLDAPKDFRFQFEMEKYAALVADEFGLDVQEVLEEAEAIIEGFGE